MSTTLTAPPRWAADGLPWSADAWRNTAFAVAGIPVHAAGLVGTLALPALGLAVAPLSVSLTVMLVMTLLFGAGCGILLTVLIPLLTQLHRSRLSALLAVDIPPVPLRAETVWRGLAGRLRSEALWRQAAYNVLAGPVVCAGAVSVLGAWALGLTLTLLPTFAWALPSASPLNQGTHPMSVVLGWLLGLALLLAAPPGAALVARGDIAAVRTLLGPNRARELQRRVNHLAVSRAAMLEAADAERRRIERDLHDGVQQRLVALAIKLGMAKVALPGLTPEAEQLLAEAHTEAKGALVELRDLVRGLYPAVLHEQGLDAALSGIAARAPFPVLLRVSAEGRAAPAVEAVAYFVVSEALANIAKHAHARQAEIHLEQDADLLRVTVVDDGVGGAEPTAGTGLTGLARRVASVDGSLAVSSPLGGGTRITVELPCAL
jgi:signal transduction histidine kinase